MTGTVSTLVMKWKLTTNGACVDEQALHVVIGRLMKLGWSDIDFKQAVQWAIAQASEADLANLVSLTSTSAFTGAVKRFCAAANAGEFYRRVLQSPGMH